jgi:drug/metabolite transporter (DMT)-like permease
MDNTGKTKTYFLLMLTAAIWGFQPLCIKWMVADWSPATITSIRYLAICAVLFSFIWKKYGYLLPPRKALGSLLLMGAMGIGLNNVLQFSGLRYTTVTNCTLISATTPAITSLLAVFWIKERLSPFSWLGIVISFSGTLVVVSHGSMEVIRNMDFNQGDVLCFLSQVAWAIYSILGLKVMKQVSAVFVTAWAGFFGALLTIAYGIITDDFHVTVLTGLPLASYLYAVFLGGVLSMVCWNVGVKNAGPSIASIFLNLMPVMGMCAGWFFFQEEIGTTQVTGALAIFAGVYLTTHSYELAAYLHKAVCLHK